MPVPPADLVPHDGRDSLGAYASALAARLRGLAPHGAEPLDERPATWLARVLVAIADARAAGESNRVLEAAIDEVEQRFVATAGKACAHAAESNTLRLLGWLYMDRARGGTHEPDEAELADALAQATFHTPVEAAWHSAWRALDRGDRAAARRLLGPAVAKVVRQRGGDPDGRLAIHIGLTIDQMAGTGGTAFQPADVAALRHTLCRNAWGLVLTDALQALPPWELGKLAGLPRRREGGYLDEDVDNARALFFELSELMSLADPTWTERLGASVETFGRDREQPLDQRRRGGRSRRSPTETDELTAEDVAWLRTEAERVAGILRRALLAQRAALYESPKPEDNKAAKILDAVAAAGGEGFQEDVHLILNPGPGAPPTLDKPAVERAVTRAFDRLRARLAAHDFFMLEDEVPEDDVADDVRLALARSAFALFEAVGPKAWKESGVEAPRLAALRVELDGASLTRVFDAFLRIDSGPEGAVALLRATRRAVRQRLASEPSNPVRVLFEPTIEPATRVPGKLTKLGFRPGRMIVFLRDAGRIVERKHDDVVHASALPRLPQPLDKTHKGRWWYLPGAELGLGSRVAEER
jgi:hypothetical protein